MRTSTFFLTGLLLLGCAGAPAVGEPRVGRLTRAEIDAAPGFHERFLAAAPDEADARALAEVPPGATVVVYLGTWCGDSRREVPRLWAALDRAGAVPFTVEYIAVDRAKQAPGGLVDGADLRYVPTFSVRRDGREIGRIVESAPRGLETELLALLRGERSGVISGRSNL